MKRVTIWDILFWLAMLILILYILAKIFEWINTPDWVDLIPLITIIFLIGVFYQKVVGFMNLMDKRTFYLKNSLNKIKDKIEEHDKRIYNLEK